MTVPANRSLSTPEYRRSRCRVCNGQILERVYETVEDARIVNNEPTGKPRLCHKHAAKKWQVELRFLASVAGSPN